MDEAQHCHVTTGAKERQIEVNKCIVGYSADSIEEARLNPIDTIEKESGRVIHCKRARLEVAEHMAFVKVVNYQIKTAVSSREH